MADLATTASVLKENYLPLIKGRQTLLLALTGVAGYLCQPPDPVDWWVFISLLGSLLLTISGCTVLNMLVDRDIDCQMERTRHRPLAEGRVRPWSAVWLGASMLMLGFLFAAVLSLPYLMVILAGALLNVVVYTFWLKRRTAWSILWGGVAGGMPILAGHVLAIGRVDLLGVLLALIIVCWIPSHNLTLSMLYSKDYYQAGVPTVLNMYGEKVSRLVVALSCLTVSLIMVIVFYRLGLDGFSMAMLFILSLGLIGLAIGSWAGTTPKLLSILYKYSSLYLLVSTVLLVLSGVS